MAWAIGNPNHGLLASRFGRKKCAHTFSMQVLFSDEDACLPAGRRPYLAANAITIANSGFKPKKIKKNILPDLNNYFKLWLSG